MTLQGDYSELEAMFLPFRDVIISDGLVMPYNVLVERSDIPVALSM